MFLVAPGNIILLC